MAAKIKLKRVGTKNRPFYRIVIQDECASPSSRVIEIIGEYSPLADPTQIKVDHEKALAWIKKGAKPTDKVRILLGKAGVLPPVDLAVLPKRKPKKAAATEEAAPEPKEEQK